MFSRMRVLLASLVVALMFATACGSGGKTGESPASVNGNGAKQDCKTEDADGNSYDKCALAKTEQVYVEATVERKFEVEGFGLLKVGQSVWLVCHTTGSSGNGNFGIVINAGADRTDGDWTLGLVDGKQAYVGMLIDVAIGDHQAKIKELNTKLEAKFGDSVNANSCGDPKVIISYDEKI